MNPQPSEWVGQIFALIFILMIAYHAIKAYHYNAPIKLNDLDLFTIGYIQSSPKTKTIVVKPIVQNKPSVVSIKPVVVSNKKKQNKIKHNPKTKHSPAPKTTTNKDSKLETQQLFIDGVDALYALGMKKSEAKRVAKNTLSCDNPPKTIQEFLAVALKKD